MKRKLLLLLSIICGSTSFAHDIEIDGIYYNYTNNNTELQVTYKGARYDNIRDEYSGSVVIPKSVYYNSKNYPVTGIRYGTFYGCTGLTSVTIPSSVTSIGSRAFEGCSGLASVNITDIASWCKISFGSPDANPLYYAHHLYMNGEEITDLNIPNSVTSLGNYAFYQCYGLTSISIPKSVTSIGDQAFYCCTGLTSVTIPNSVTNIGGGAFRGCSGLTSVTIPNSVTSIGGSAFGGCSGLTSVTIPNSVTSIGEYAFSFCSGLASVNITDIASWCKISFGSADANPLYYAHQLYMNGNEITDLNIPNSVTSIGDYTFFNCRGLNSVSIPCSVTSIGGCAFQGCSGLTSVTIPNSVTSIGGCAFLDCSGLTSVTIPNSVTSIGEYAFSGCDRLTSISIFNPNIRIEKNAFNYCDYLMKIFVPDGAFYLSSDIRTILPSAIIYYLDNNFYSDGNNIFILDKTSNSAQLVNMADTQGNVTIPKYINVTDELQMKMKYDVTSIAKYAIYGKQIKSLTIGENIKTIEVGALKNKPIKTIWLTNTPPTGYSYASGDINYVANDQYTSLNNKYVYPYISSIFEVDGIRYVPVSPSERTCDAIDCLYGNTVENLHIGKEVSFKGVSMKVNNILDYICASNPYIKSLTIDSECDILYQAFKGCINLETASLTNRGNIGDNAFQNCTNLSTLAINNQGNINDYAFSGCENLKTIEINSLGSIGNRSFEKCKSLENVNINNSGSIGECAFANLKNLQTVTFGNNVTSLGDRCFSGCENLRPIDIPDNITSIGNYCFSGCTQLSNVTIGNGVKSIGSYALSGCSNLNKIILGSSLTTIENYLFNNCSSLTDIEIPISVSQIGDYVFSGCTGLKNVSFKDSNTTLSLGRNGSNPLFADCPLDYVYIGRDISYNTSSSYGYSPFYRNTTLRSVIISDKETEISNYEFYGCSGLKNVIIGNGVTSIGDWAFSGCSSLESFSFGSNVKTIGKEAFSDCTAMTRLESHANTPPTCGSQALDDINKWNCQLYVPETSLSAYQSADQWKDFFFINTSTVDPLIKDMLELRIKSDSLITSYNSNNGGSTSGGTITNNVDSLSKAAFTTPPTGLLTSASQLSSNAKATNEGSYEALLDGNQTTYFHTTWLSGKGDAPNEDHYLQIDLQEEVESIALKYGARGSITNYVNPNNITIYATNNVNGNWTQITTATLTYDNNSNGKGLLSIDLGGKYRYIRISVQNSTLSRRTINGHAYWCLGELRIYNIGTGSQEGTTPQENDEKPQVPKEVVENLQNCINAAGTEISTNAATQSTYDALLSAYNTFLGYLNESTDIERVQITPSVDVWFDLQGRRIAKPQTSGIYIHNGKKVWVK